MKTNHTKAVDKTAEAHAILNEAHWAYRKSLVNEKTIYTCLEALNEALPEKDHANQIVEKVRISVSNSRYTRGVMIRLKRITEKALKENNELTIKLEREKELRFRDRFFFVFVIAAVFIICGLSHIEC